MDKKQDVCLAFTTIKSTFAVQHPFCFRFKLINYIHSHYLNTACHCERYVHVDAQITNRSAEHRIAQVELKNAIDVLTITSRRSPNTIRYAII